MNKKMSKNRMLEYKPCGVGGVTFTNGEPVKVTTIITTLLRISNETFFTY